MRQEQWYPGHIKKARSRIKTLLKQCNSVILVLDSRAPYSSTAFNEFEYLKTKKNLLILLNKSDLADPIKTKQWKDYFLTKGFNVMIFSSKFPVKKYKILDIVKIKGKITKVLVMGIPNVGKSTILNYLIGKKSAKTGNKAGITRGVQWVSLDDTTLMLDTPGILFANVSNEDLFQKLFYIKAINTDQIDIVEHSYALIEFLGRNYTDLLNKLYPYKSDPVKYLEEFCLNKNFIMKGNTPDLKRGAFHIFNIVTNGKLGKITFESVDDEYVK